MNEFIIIFASIAIVAIAAMAWAFWKLQQPVKSEGEYKNVSDQVLMEMGEYIRRQLYWEENDRVQLDVDVEGFDPINITLARNVYEKDNMWFIDLITATNENGKEYYPELIADRLERFIN